MPHYAPRFLVIVGLRCVNTVSPTKISAACQPFKGSKDHFVCPAWTALRPRFFIEPSFAPKMVDKEVNAVDSEHKKRHGCTMFFFSGF